jgi:hypothetical protein
MSIDWISLPVISGFIGGVAVRVGMMVGGMFQ